MCISLKENDISISVKACVVCKLDLSSFLSWENSPRLLYPVIKHADISHSRHGFKQQNVKMIQQKDQTILVDTILFFVQQHVNATCRILNIKGGFLFKTTLRCDGWWRCDGQLILWWMDKQENVYTQKFYSNKTIMNQIKKKRTLRTKIERLTKNKK